ncbi:MAG: hypothetical protein NW208_08140 [Bryobacter sp.]|nr:hypothetical protein [Bryobacter sp.]
MEQMLPQVVALLIQALPTLLVVIFLHWYLKATLFQPVEKVLQERYSATEGARLAATQALAQAEQKVAEYDRKLRDARTEIYKEQEAWRSSLLAQQNAQLAQAREDNQKLAQEAKAQIQQQVAAAQATLTQEADQLAAQIVTHVLRGSRN